MYNAPTGAIVGGASAQNFRIYWDGDIYDEILNDKGGGHNQPFLEKYNGGGLVVDGKRLFEHGYTTSCNGTKTSPCLQADIFGDWREELIFFNGSDKTTINIFSTALKTEARVPCLMFDHVYRMGIAWQNVGYNQPPHLGYYLPNATAARFTLDDINIIHYVNCTGAQIVSVTAPDGTTSETLPDGVTMDQNTRLCNLVFNGLESAQGQWLITLSSIGSGNGTETIETFTLKFGELTGIEEITDNRSANRDDLYDLSGRRVKTPVQNGIYISNGKKVVTNKMQ